MKPGPNGKGRPRGRNNHSQPQNYGKGRGPSRNQVYDSNGPGIRVRGNAHQVVEKYQALARDAAAIGDRILCENYFQHAEHYLRIISVMNQNTPPRTVVPIERGSEDESHADESGAVVEAVGIGMPTFPTSPEVKSGPIETANDFSANEGATEGAASFEEGVSRRPSYESSSLQAPSVKSSSRGRPRNGNTARVAPPDVSLPDAPQPFVAVPGSVGDAHLCGVAPATSPNVSGEQGELHVASSGEGVKKVRRRRAPRPSGDTPEENPTESLDV